MNSNLQKFILISGPSGSGKDTVKAKVFEAMPGVFEETVSCTTRKIRSGEKEGIHYHFLTQDEFKKKIENNEFLEWAEYAGNYYGTLKSEVQRILSNHKTPVAIIEVQGVLQIKENLSPDQRLSIFILPESIDQLKKQIAGRNQDMSPEDLETRMETAKKEIEIGKQEYDYQVVNKFGELEKTVKQFLSIIQNL